MEAPAKCSYVKWGEETSPSDEHRNKRELLHFSHSEGLIDRYSCGRSTIEDGGLRGALIIGYIWEGGGDWRTMQCDPDVNVVQDFGFSFRFHLIPGGKWRGKRGRRLWRRLQSIFVYSNRRARTEDRPSSSTGRVCAVELPEFNSGIPLQSSILQGSLFQHPA